jgi:hypothetical protein
VDFFSSILKIFNSTLTLGIDGLVYYYYIILPDSLVNLRYQHLISSPVWGYYYYYYYEEGCV